MHRYYLGGQSILAVNADEKSWLVSDVAQTTRLFDPLRRSESMLLLRLTREFRQQSSAAVDMLQQFGQLCFDLNLGMLQGALRSDPLGCSLCKHQLSCLHDTASACVCVCVCGLYGVEVLLTIGTCTPLTRMKCSRPQLQTME